MQRNRILALTSSALAGLLWLAGLPAGAQHPHPQPAGHTPEASATTPREQELKVGKSDDLEFAKEVRVGEVTLKPGQYRIRHRVEGADHFVRFEHLVITTPSAQKLGTEPLDAKAQMTTLYLLNEAGGQRLLKVRIRGENVAHAF